MLKIFPVVKSYHTLSYAGHNPGQDSDTALILFIGWCLK